MGRTQGCQRSAAGHGGAGKRATRTPPSRSVIDPKLIREEPDLVRKVLIDRNSPVDFDALLKTDEVRRAIQTKVDGLRAEKNKSAEAFGKMKREGKGDSPEAVALMKSMKELDAGMGSLEKERTEAEAKYDDILARLPNIPHESVPVGKSDNDNKELRKWGEPRKFPFKAKTHWDIGEALEILDFPRAANVAGGRFSLFRGAGAILERALINFMLNLHRTKHGYTEVSPPFLALPDSMFCTGQLPNFDEDMFKTREPDSLYLIPTAEVSLVNIHRGEILDGAKLPIKYVAYTPSFRREAGTYGKETRGLIRQHQFDKVEQVQFVKPEDSMTAQEEITRCAEAVLQALGLPYRVMLLCTSAMSQASARTCDLEVWFPGMNSWQEIASCSTCTDYQARRGQIRFRRDKSGKTELVHTLNGSGVAVGRTFAAMLENYQNEDGSITLPEVLKPFMAELTIRKT